MDRIENTTGTPIKQSFSSLTPKMMLELAAPHTWPASIFPVLIACALAIAQLPTHSVSGIMVCVLLAISVLFQSAVNTINDYFDYVKGTDTLENSEDPTDAVLVYNNVNPRSALLYAAGLLATAFLLGIYCIAAAGWPPLLIAIIGAAIVVLYSGGKTPISYLPIGEVVSGVTMGALITFASYICLTLQIDFRVFVWSIPLVLAIALIMMTNNTCDIEKDIQAGRKTLPVLLGHERSVMVYHGIIYTWLVSICLIILIWFRAGWIILPFMLLAVHPLGRALLSNPLTSSSRAGAFAQCTSLNMVLGAFYACAILASMCTVCIL